MAHVGTRPFQGEQTLPRSHQQRSHHQPPESACITTTSVSASTGSDCRATSTSCSPPTNTATWRRTATLLVEHVRPHGGVEREVRGRAPRDGRPGHLLSRAVDVTAQVRGERHPCHRRDRSPITTDRHTVARPDVTYTMCLTHRVRHGLNRRSRGCWRLMRCRVRTGPRRWTTRGTGRCTPPGRSARRHRAPRWSRRGRSRCPGRYTADGRRSAHRVSRRNCPAST